MTCAALAVGAAIPAFGQERIDNAPDPYVHEQTGFAFPIRIGRFIRHEVDRYSADGADTGVGYDLIVGYVSVFVYPVPSEAMAGDELARDAACKQLFSGIKSDVQTRSSNAVLKTEHTVAAPSPNFHVTGWLATFSNHAPFAGKDQPLHDEAYLFCYAGARWLVAYRATWPIRRDASADVAALMISLTWPLGLDR